MLLGGQTSETPRGVKDAGEQRPHTVKFYLDEMCRTAESRETDVAQGLPEARGRVGD